MSGIYNEFKLMTLEELKDEYYNCKDKDKVKKQILKKIIKERIEKEKQQKELREREIKKNKSSDSGNNSDNNSNSKTSELIDKLINLKNNAEKEKQIKKIKDLEPVIQKRGNMEQYWESYQNEKEIDKRFIKEINIDHSNNKLMERLNGELDFRIHGDHSKDDIIKPYSDLNEGNYKDFEKYTIPISSFTQKRYSTK